MNEKKEISLEEIIQNLDLNEQNDNSNSIKISSYNFEIIIAKEAL